MKYYAGLDVAMKETFICILNEQGHKIYESSCHTDPQLIYEVQTRLYMEAVLFEIGGSYPILPYQLTLRLRSGEEFIRPIDDIL